MSDTITVEVTVKAGMYLPGHGSRERGETFVLPAEKAESLLKLYPDRLKPVGAGGKLTPRKKPVTPTKKEEPGHDV